jgi:predicted GIY-YIG superfamily endonuclease
MVYLIHFKTPLKHASHYIGFTETPETLERRIDHHRKGSGAKLMRAVVEAGIEFEVVRTWDDADRDFERKLKNKKNSRILCPICNQALKTL